MNTDLSRHPGYLLNRSRTQRIALARAAIDLRRRVVAVISSGETSLKALSRDSAEAWRVFLAAECCALPLAAELRRRGLADRLDVVAREALRSAELRETKRVLAARTTLDALDAIGGRLGVPIIALKGGEAIAVRDTSAFDLGDVDILVGASAVQRLWNALKDQGWAPTREAIIPGMETDLNHFEPLIPPGAGLPVELHRDIRYGQSGSFSPSYERIDGRAALHRLNRLDAARLMLWHSVVQHPHRRGHLRDLFMLAGVVRGLPSRDREALEASVTADPFAPELGEMLAAARYFGTSDGIELSSTTERFVAWKYATLLRVDWVVDEILPGWTALGHLPLERRAIRSQMLRAEVRRAFGPVPRESRFRPGWSGRLPARAQIAIGWLARLAGRLTMVALLRLAGGRLRRVSEDLIGEPSS
jgi:hypothetical protein